MYGPKGHAGSYARGNTDMSLVGRLRRHLARLHIEGVLSEGQFVSMAEIDRISARQLADEVRDEQAARAAGACRCIPLGRLVAGGWRDAPPEQHARNALYTEQSQFTIMPFGRVGKIP